MRISAATWRVDAGDGGFDIVGVDLIKVGKAGRGGKRCRTTLFVNSRIVNKYPSRKILQVIIILNERIDNVLTM